MFPLVGSLNIINFATFEHHAKVHGYGRIENCKIMNFYELKQKPLWQMTGEEFLFLFTQENEQKPTPSISVIDTTKRKHVYGILGIAKLFGCSIPTAHRIKKSGKINQAITQIGRKIIVDADLALELAAKKEGGRK